MAKKKRRGTSVEVLKTLGALIKRDMYGLEITKFLEKRAKTTLSLGTVYNVLNRLQDEKYVNGRYEDYEDVKKRGGHRRCIYTVTEAGIEFYLNEIRSFDMLNEENNVNQILSKEREIDSRSTNSEDEGKQRSKANEVEIPSTSAGELAGA